MAKPTLIIWVENTQPPEVEVLVRRMLDEKVTAIDTLVIAGAKAATYIPDDGSAPIHITIKT